MSKERGEKKDKGNRLFSLKRRSAIKKSPKRRSFSPFGKEEETTAGSVRDSKERDRKKKGKKERMVRFY